MTTGSFNSRHLTGLTAALAHRDRLERELGAGGMATVWLAEDMRHRRQVAIEVLHPELSHGAADPREPLRAGDE